MPGGGHDPDAMWKPGYVPPTRDDGADEDAGDAGTEDREATHHWRPPRPADDDGPSPGPVDQPAPIDAAASTVVPRASAPEIEVEVPRGATVADARPVHRRRRAWIAGAAAAALVVAAVGAVLVVVDGDDDTVRTALPRVPDSVDVRWTAVLPGERVEVVGVGDVVVVASADRSASVAGLDASSGEERWSVRTGRADSLGGLLVAGDVVLVTSGGRTPMIRAIDPDDGEELWQRRIRADDDVAAFGASVAVIDRTGDSVRVLALDPATGEAARTLHDPTAKVGDAFIRIDGVTVEAFDEGLRRIAGPLDLADTPISVAVVGDVIVSAGSGRLRATEFDGRERWVMDIEPASARYLLPSAASPGDVLLVSTSSITAIDTRGADPVTRWEVEGGAVVNPSAPGTRYVPVSPSPGSSLLRIIDLRDGEMVALVSTAGATGAPLVGVDGLVLARRLEGTTWEVEARRLDDGAPTWRTELPGRPSLVDRGVVAVAPVDDGVQLTYAGTG